MNSFQKLLLFTAVWVCIVSAGTRVSQIGSNPYYSWQAFPQDVSAWQGNFLFYSPQYMKSPWWGDIDEPGNKPNATYTTTGQEVTETDADFQHGASRHTVSNQFGYAHHFPEGPAASVELHYTVDALRGGAEGNMTGEGNSRIPFDYRLNHTLNSIDLRGMVGTLFHDVPVGFKFDAGFNNSVLLDQNFEFNKDGRRHATDRALWGWSTSGCNHIFGPRTTEGDAWLQQDYSTGPVYRAELQGGATLAKAKVGMVFGYSYGQQENFVWTRDTTMSSGDAVIDRNFVGEYQQSDWNKNIRSVLLRTYANYTIKSGEQYAMNLFGGAGFEGRTQGRYLSSNPAVEDDNRDLERRGTLDFAPNINITFGENFHYIDMAFITTYGYTRFSNVYERNTGGGRETSFRTGYVDTAGPEQVWESMSYANENYVDVGVDLNAMFPLMNGPAGSFGLGPALYIHTRHTFLTKYYGSYNNSEFRIDWTRENYNREIWFNSALVFQYAVMPYLVRFEITEPLLYSLLPRERLRHGEGGSLQYEHEKESLWTSQEGMRVAAYVSYQWTAPFLR